MSLPRRLDAPALRDDVRPAADQFSRQRRRQRNRRERARRGPLDREPAIRPGAEQRRELVLRERDPLAELRDLLARRGDRRFRLLDLQSRVDAGRVAIARQRVDPLALGKCRLRDVELAVRASERDIGLRDVRRQREPRGIRIDFGGACGAERRLVGRAVLAPEVDLPGERRLKLRGCLRAAAERRRRAAVRREALACHRCVGVDARQQCGVARLGERDCSARSRGGDVERRTGGQRFVDQSVELGVPERFPPVARGPRRVGHACVGERALRAQFVRAAHRRLRRESAGACATGEQRQACDPRGGGGLT